MSAALGHGDIPPIELPDEVRRDAIDRLDPWGDARTRLPNAA